MATMRLTDDQYIVVVVTPMDTNGGRPMSSQPRTQIHYRFLGWEVEMMKFGDCVNHEITMKQYLKLKTIL